MRCTVLLLFPLFLLAGSNQHILAHMFKGGSFPDLAAKEFKFNLDKSLYNNPMKIISGAKLGDERANIRQLTKGEIEFAIVGDLVLEYMTPEYRIISLPFTHRDAKEALDVYDGKLGDIIRETLRKNGIEVLSYHCIGQRMLTANAPIREIKDLKGLKLRLPPAAVWMATWGSLGANTRAVAFPKLYEALKTGEVDAQENPPNFIISNKFYEVQKYLMLTKHLVQRQFILANKAHFDSHDEKRKKAIKEAAKKASEKICKKAIDDQAVDIQWLKSEGKMEVIDLDLFDEAAKKLPEVAKSLNGDEGLAILKEITKK